MAPVSSGPARVTLFQHVENEPAGLIEIILAEKGIPFEYVRLFETNEIPQADSSHLIFLGGPMSVNDEKDLPWLVEEKKLIRNSVRKCHQVLGICLGAQLIASAFGAKVYPSVPENGWRRVRNLGTGPFSGYPAVFPVFQLHGETFDIPAGGTLLCSGDEVKNQAFSIGSAIGLQFHLELTGDLIRDWSRALPPEEQAAITRDTPRCLSESNAICRTLAGDFINGKFR